MHHTEFVIATMLLHQENHRGYERNQEFRLCGTRAHPQEGQSDGDLNWTRHWNMGRDGGGGGGDTRRHGIRVTVLRKVPLKKVELGVRTALAVDRARLETGSSLGVTLDSVPPPSGPSLTFSLLILERNPTLGSVPAALSCWGPGLPAQESAPLSSSETLRIGVPSFQGPHQCKSCDQCL